MASFKWLLVTTSGKLISYFFNFRASSGLHPLLSDGSCHGHVLHVLDNLCWARTIQPFAYHGLRFRTDNKTLPPSNRNRAIPNLYRRNLRRLLPFWSHCRASQFCSEHRNPHGKSTKWACNGSRCCFGSPLLPGNTEIRGKFQWNWGSSRIAGSEYFHP